MLRDSAYIRVAPYENDSIEQHDSVEVKAPPLDSEPVLKTSP